MEQWEQDIYEFEQYERRCIEFENEYRCDICKFSSAIDTDGKAVCAVTGRDIDYHFDTCFTHHVNHMYEDAHELPFKRFDEPEYTEVIS